MRRAVRSAVGSLERKLSFVSRPISFNATTTGLSCTHELRVIGARPAPVAVNLVPKRFSSQSAHASTSPPDDTPLKDQGNKSDPSDAPRSSSTKTTKNPSSESTSEPTTASRPKWTNSRRYPPRRVQLVGRTGNLVNFAPSAANIPIDTSMPHLVWPNGKPITKYNTLFRPPYLTERLAPHLDVQSDDPYLLSRSIELFGRSGLSDWVAVFSEKIDKARLRGGVTEFLAALPWEDTRVRQLRDAALAEHVEAMQNPRLKNGPDDYEAHPENEVIAPGWPSDSDSDPDLGLSWSSSSERDIPFKRSSTTFAKAHFPRPKLIARVQPWDTHLIVAFATPTARRAVLAAYEAWVRWRLLEAYRDGEELRGIPVLPPISRSDFGELTVGRNDLAIGKKELEAIQWAEEAGWRPEYRVRAYHGGRTRTGSGDDKWYESTRMRKKRLAEEALAAEKEANE